MAMEIKSGSGSFGIQQALQKSLGKLASGKRLNSAADDAAGFAIAVNMEAQERSLAMTSRNALDAVGRIQVADGGLEAQGESLARLRELAVQASNGTLSGADRDAIATEMRSTLDEMNRVAGDAEYNGESLLSGDSTREFQVGTDGSSNSRIGVTIQGSTTTSLGVDGIDFSSVAAATSALEDIDSAIERVSANRTSLGAAQNRLASAYMSSSVARESAAASRSRLQDTDVANETAALSQSMILQQAELSVMAQSRAQKSSMLRLLD